MGSEYMGETQDCKKKRLAFILNVTPLAHAQGGKIGRLHHVRGLQEAGETLAALRSLAIVTAAPRSR